VVADCGSSGAAGGYHGGGDGDDGEPAFRSALVFVVRDAGDDGEQEQLHQCLVNDDLGDLVAAALIPVGSSFCGLVVMIACDTIPPECIRCYHPLMIAVCMYLAVADISS
jgi:hypothetical protein